MPPTPLRRGRPRPWLSRAWLRLGTALPSEAAVTPQRHAGTAHALAICGAASLGQVYSLPIQGDAHRHGWPGFSCLSDNRALCCLLHPDRSDGHSGHNQALCYCQSSDSGPRLRAVCTQEHFLRVLSGDPQLRDRACRRLQKQTREQRSAPSLIKFIKLELNAGLRSPGCCYSFTTDALGSPWLSSTSRGGSGFPILGPSACPQGSRRPRI